MPAPRRIAHRGSAAITRRPRAGLSRWVAGVIAAMLVALTGCTAAPPEETIAAPGVTPATPGETAVATEVAPAPPGDRELEIAITSEPRLGLWRSYPHRPDFVLPYLEEGATFSLRWSYDGGQTWETRGGATFGGFSTFSVTIPDGDVRLLVEQVTPAVYRTAAARDGMRWLDPEWNRRVPTPDLYWTEPLTREPIAGSDAFVVGVDVRADDDFLELIVANGVESP